MRIRFKIEEGGWARAWVEHDGVAFPMEVSYISDSLGDLVRATLDVLRGQAAEFFWNKEPGSYRWRLRLGESSGVSVQIEELPREFLDGDRSDRAGDDRFEALVPANEFGLAVLKTMESVSPSLYSRSWDEYSYPTAEVERLRDAIGGRGGAA
jgi:hypothetical protein